MDASIFRDSLNSYTEKLVAELYSIKDLPRTRVPEMLCTFEDLLQQSFVTNFFTNIITRLQDLGESSNNLADFKAMFRMMQNPFQNFNTEDKCFRHFKRSGTFIEPEELEVDDDDEHLPGNPPQSIKKSAFIQFIPLRKVLKKFFELPGIFESVESYTTKILKFSTFKFSLIQSEFWKSVQADAGGELVLPLLFYQDDVETNNALGSHKGIGKIGVVYIVIPCLPPNLQSKTENIFLLTLYKSSDANNVSLKSILVKAVEEVKFLQREGITVRTSFGERKLNFRLVSVIGDNLAVHNLLGFSRSFSATFSCRFCMITKSDISKVFNLSSCNLRTNESLGNHIKQNDPKSTGVSGPSALGNSLALTLNLLSVDFMHDLLEGGNEHAVGLVLHCFIVQKQYFTLDDLNDRIASCDFGDESRNKPVPIKMKKITEKHIKMSAAEALCFIRNIGIIIGDLVPEDDEHWRIVRLLKEIIDIVTAPVVHSGVADLLESVISEYLLLLNDLFPKCLKPKHHLLLHYPDVMRRFGPLWQFSTMRCESKHRDLTVTAHVSLSRVNICKTLAIKAQLCLNNRLLAGHQFTNNVYDVKHLKTFTICDIVDAQSFMQFLLPLKSSDKIQAAESIIFQGKTINSGTVLMISDEKQYVFHIVHVLLIDAASKLHIISKNVTKSTDFDDHHQAYSLNSCYAKRGAFDWHCLTEEDLPWAFFSRVSRVPSGKLFIPKRWIHA